MRVLELFAGYGSQALALENLGIDFTSDISEIDKYAIDAYNQLHGYTKNWGDITKIDEKELPYYDLITYSFPCQDISLAGLQKGLDKDSETRSSLLWECERIIRAVKPKYLLMENVKNLVGEKHKHNFIRWLRVLEMMGYQNYWQVLNAKDYGVPQNRERVFVVSILGFEQYLFPNPIKLEKRLKDVLEQNVDEKYYLSNNMLKYIQNKADKPYNYPVETSDISDIRNTPLRSGGDFACIKEPLALDEQNDYIRTDGIVGTLTTDGSSPKHNNRVIEPQVIGGVGEINFGKQYRQGNRVYASDKISPALLANNGNASGGSILINEPLLIKEATQKGYAEAYDGDSISLDQPNSETRRGRVGNQISNTLTTSCNIGVVQCEPLPLNAYKDGTCRTIKAQYQNSSLANFTREGSYAATGVVQVGNIVNTGNWDNPQRGRIYSENGCSPALNTAQGGGLEPKIVTYDIPQTVTVRKHSIDTAELVKALRESKAKSNVSNIQIAERLNLPLTKVEHWFRTDNSFAIPDKDVWFKLKEIINLTSDEYDAFITEFEEKDGVFEKANRCYGTDGIAPTMTSTSADEKIVSNYRIRKLTPRECWRLMGVKDEQFDKISGISNSQLYKLAGNSIVVDVLMGIFKNLLLSDEGTNGQLTLF